MIYVFVIFPGLLISMRLVIYYSAHSMYTAYIVCLRIDTSIIIVIIGWLSCTERETENQQTQWLTRKASPLLLIQYNKLYVFHPHRLTVYWLVFHQQHETHGILTGIASAPWDSRHTDWYSISSAGLTAYWLVLHQHRETHGILTGIPSAARDSRHTDWYSISSVRLTAYWLVFHQHRETHGILTGIPSAAWD